MERSFLPLFDDLSHEFASMAASTITRVFKIALDILVQGVTWVGASSPIARILLSEPGIGDKMSPSFLARDYEIQSDLKKISL